VQPFDADRRCFAQPDDLDYTVAARNRKSSDARKRQGSGRDRIPEPRRAGNPEYGAHAACIENVAADRASDIRRESARAAARQ
jgi:hypothetical protein